MKTLLQLSLLLFCLSFHAQGQLTEHFDDNDFSSNPPWTGDTMQWRIQDGVLQSNCLQTNTGFYLSAASSAIKATQWDCKAELLFNPSSRNYVRLYLSSDLADPIAPDNTGYFVEIGGTADEISFYRQDAGKVQKLIDGQDKVTNHSRNTLRIRVTCSNDHRWTLWRDTTGTGDHFIAEGSCTDSAYLQGSYFSIFVYQSTASFFQKHFFDDILIQPFAPDTTAPSVQSVYATADTQLQIRFSEPVLVPDAQQPEHYQLSGNIGSPDSIVCSADAQEVSLFFRQPFPEDDSLYITVSGIRDVSGNSMPQNIFPFEYHKVKAFDVVIDEIMADPDPGVGLPAAEYVELRNNSPVPVNLQGWTLSDDTRSAVLPSFSMAAGSLLILCNGKDTADFSHYGTALGLAHFPSLNNDGDLLTLRDANGNWIHAVMYSTEWYHDTEKSHGGWSLEMKDVHHPCGIAENWSASEDLSGGTPGKANSVSAAQTAPLIPDLLHVAVLDSLHIEAFFSQTLDSMLAEDISLYHLDANMLEAHVRAPLFSSVVITLADPLQSRHIYTLTVTGLRGCGMATIGVKNSATFGWPEKPLPGDVVFSELLFHPFTGGEEFVEIYNRSHKIIDLDSLVLGKRNAEGEMTQQHFLSTTGQQCMPGTYVVITPDPDDIRSRYFCQYPDNFVQLKSMASLPDDHGDLVLTDASDTILDEVIYDEHMYFSLIQNPAGISLEKTDETLSSQLQSNWQSAGADVGYATPTYRNSHSGQQDTTSLHFSIMPKVIAPGYSGRDEIASIPYHVAQGDWVANITVFNAYGQPVRQLYRSFYLSSSGTLRWDGKDDHAQTVTTGLYIVLVNVFSKEGQTRTWKLPVTVVKKE